MIMKGSKPFKNYRPTNILSVLNMDNRIRLDKKLMSRGLISYGRLVGSCFKMALDGSIIVEICDETMAKMWRKPVKM